MAKKKEPTLRDILDGMNNRFNMVFEELKRFDLVYSHLHSLRKDVQEIKETQKTDGELLEEMNSTLTGVAKAVDRDAVTVIDHEKRLRKLEHAR